MKLINLCTCLSALLLVLLLTIPLPLCADEAGLPYKNDFSVNREKDLTSGEKGIWAGGIGGGFRAGTHVLGIGIGGTRGVIILGGEERHNLALFSVSYGWMIGDVKGKDWYRGNWEIRGELFGGAQMNSETDGIIGITPHIRYHFATGSPIVPYLDAGAGVAFTDIRAPDLGGTFQFNLQASAGVNYFIRDAVAIHLEARYIHVSSASIHSPNNGINTIGVFMGVSTYF